MSKLYYDDPLQAAYIPLSQGKEAIIDAEDYAMVSAFKWSLTNNKSGHPYARTAIWHSGKQKHIRMHRMILDAPEGIHIDHINGNGLDNRRCNLRFCNDMQNQQNGSSRRGSSSKYKGVSYHKRDNKWIAQIRRNKKLCYLGMFEKEAEAARAYNRAAKEYFGEFAKLNEVANG